MKLWLCLLLILCGALAQDNPQSNQHARQIPLTENVDEIGAIASGKLDLAISTMNLHYIQIRKLEKKYLFVRVTSNQLTTMSIGIYSNKTQNIVHECRNTSLDNCFVPKEKLIENQVYVVLVTGTTNFQYMLYTYWADLEHLIPGNTIKFSFAEKDTTQLFHLELDKIPNYQQIRIILKPETSRSHKDNMKMFASLEGVPTEQKHDYESVSVWGDSQGLFFTKKSLEGELGVTIFITGYSDTIYTLECEVIEKSHHDIMIGQAVSEYIEAQQTVLYHVNFSTNATVDIYALKASLFSGEIEVAFFYDEKMDKPYTKEPMQYMSDIEFVFEQSELKGYNSSIYMLVKCPDSSAVYQIMAQGRMKGKAFEITENIYEFLPVQKKQAVFFYHHEIKNELEMGAYEYEEKFNFEMSAIFVQGYLGIQFYACRTQVSEESCKDYTSPNFKSVATHIKSNKQDVGKKTIYKIEVGKQFLASINSLEERMMIVAVISNQDSMKTPGLITLELSNLNKIRVLREERAFQDRLGLREIKYYKYVNNDPTIYAITIFVNDISGLADIQIRHTDFRSDESSYSVIAPDSSENKNSYVITEDLTKPIFIKITGMVPSVYSISINTLHRDHPLSAALTLAEDIDYEIKIKPSQFANVQIHPVEENVVLEYRTEGGEVNICELNRQGLCKTDENGKTHMFTGSKGIIKIEGSDIRSVNYRLNNFGSQVNSDYSLRTLPTTIKVNLIYHSAQERHCEARKVNKIYNEVAPSGACFKFQLPLVGNLQIFHVREDTGKMIKMFMICDSIMDASLFDEFNERIVLSSKTISQKCKDSLDNLYVEMVMADTNGSDVRSQYSVEYTEDPITLADGVGYHVAARITESPIRTFFYEVLDETKPLEISMFNSKGTQHFYIDIKEDTYIAKYKSVNEAKAVLTSKSSDFYSNPSIQVTPEHLANAKCYSNCVVIITTYSMQKVGNIAEFTLEVTQGQIVLAQDSIRNDFLAKNSVKFYKYQVAKDKTQLMITASDNGRSCEKIYLSKKPYPSPSNYFSSETTGVLIYNDAQKGLYYIAVQALEDCEYHLSVSQNNASLTKLDYGQYYDLKLKEGEGKWFYNHHAAHSNFKIMSLIKFGSIKIYANQTSFNEKSPYYEHLVKGTADYAKFDFVTGYKNSLMIKYDQKGFCTDCHYLIYIKAEALTETTIFMGDENSKVSLTPGKVLYDEFDEMNVTSLATYYKVSSGKMMVKVHSGQINVKMSYDGKETQRTYKQDKKVYREEYNYTKKVSDYSPIKIEVTPVTVPAFYSYELIPNDDPTQRQEKVNPGEHTYVFLSNGEEKCLTGFIKKKNELIFMSVDTDEDNYLRNLKINASLNGEQTPKEKYETELEGNILSFKFLHESVFFMSALPYKICISTNETDKSLSVVAFQDSKVNLIHSDTEVMVRNESTFVMYPKGDIIVDVFECKGKSEIFFANSQKKLTEAASKDLDVIGIPGQSHAIKIEEFSTLYLRVKADMATMIWTPLVPAKERGVGYFKYSIGELEYESVFNNIKFKVGAVHTTKETNTTVKRIKYTLYISNSKEELQEAVMCEKEKDESIVRRISVHSTVGKNSDEKISIKVPKDKITSLVDTNKTLYFNAVADMTLNPPNSTEEEHYRFIYFGQQVPTELFRPHSLENMQLGLLITLAVVSVMGVIVVALVFVKWCVPALGLLKNRMFVEEKEQDRDESIPVPPSSDRNQIGTNELQSDVDAPKQTDQRLS